MLKLDEKKIRKGKPFGLPYQGSKKKISKKIVEIIKQNFGTDKKIYDIFGGGGAITAECMLNNLEVHLRLLISMMYLVAISKQTHTKRLVFYARKKSLVKSETYSDYSN